MNSEEKRKTSPIQIKIKIQEILAEHTRPAIGRFHSKELDEKNFVNDLIKNFEIKIK